MDIPKGVMCGTIVFICVVPDQISDLLSIRMHQVTRKHLTTGSPSSFFSRFPYTIEVGINFIDVFLRSSKNCTELHAI